MNTYTGYTLVTAVQDFFKRYFDFSGRSTLSAYWYWYLASLLLGIVANLIDRLVFQTPAGDTGLVSGIWGLIVFIPGLALWVRRMHDIGKSGWVLLWAFIPTICLLISAIWLLVAAEMSGEITAESVVQQLTPLIAVGVSSVLAFIGYILLFVYSLKDSQKGTNKWGPSEKYPDEIVD